MTSVELQNYIIENHMTGNAKELDSSNITSVFKDSYMGYMDNAVALKNKNNLNVSDREFANAYINVVSNALMSDDALAYYTDDQVANIITEMLLKTDTYSDDITKPTEIVKNNIEEENIEEDIEETDETDAKESEESGTVEKNKKKKKKTEQEEVQSDASNNQNKAYGNNQNNNKSKQTQADNMCKAYDDLYNSGKITWRQAENGKALVNLTIIASGEASLMKDNVAILEYFHKATDKRKFDNKIMAELEKEIRRREKLMTDIYKLSNEHLKQAYAGTLGLSTNDIYKDAAAKLIHDDMKDNQEKPKFSLKPLAFVAGIGAIVKTTGPKIREKFDNLIDKIKNRNKSEKTNAEVIKTFENLTSDRSEINNPANKDIQKKHESDKFSDMIDTVEKDVKDNIIEKADDKINNKSDINNTEDLRDRQIQQLMNTTATMQNQIDSLHEMITRMCEKQKSQNIKATNPSDFNTNIAAGASVSADLRDAMNEKCSDINNNQNSSVSNEDVMAAFANCIDTRKSNMAMNMNFVTFAMTMQEMCKTMNTPITISFGDVSMTIANNKTSEKSENTKPVEKSEDTKPVEKSEDTKPVEKSEDEDNQVDDNTPVDNAIADGIGIDLDEDDLNDMFAMDSALFDELNDESESESESEIEPESESKSEPESESESKTETKTSQRFDRRMNSKLAQVQSKAREMTDKGEDIKEQALGD